MNIEKDYIMREVQKMVQVLQVILGLKQQKKYDEAMVEIHDAYKQHFDDEQLLESKTVDDLINLCTKEGEFSPDLAFALADIIREEAEILEIKEKADQAREKYKLSLGLYREALAEEDAAVPIDVAAKMDKIQQVLEEL